MRLTFLLPVTASILALGAAGAAWIGISKEHYGIHGTPDPGHVRHGESAGCIRMTNWVLLLLCALGPVRGHLREGMRVERGEAIGFVGSTGNADPGTPHLHFAIFELGPEKLWWKGTAVDPYPGLVAAVKRAK